jgi:hypothetical protein
MARMLAIEHIEHHLQQKQKYSIFILNSFRKTIKMEQITKMRSLFFASICLTVSCFYLLISFHDQWILSNRQINPHWNK